MVFNKRKITLSVNVSHISYLQDMRFVIAKDTLADDTITIHV